MLTVYMVPGDLIDAAWLPTDQSIAQLWANGDVREMFSFGDAHGDQADSEERELRELLISPLAHIVPAVHGHALPVPAATRISNKQLSNIQSALWDGPWRGYFENDLGIFDELQETIEEALEEGADLLIVRTKSAPEE